MEVVDLDAVCPNVHAETLGEIDELLQHLRSESAEKRRAAALLLGAAGLVAAYESLGETEEAVIGLLAALNDPEPEVRAQVIWSLDEINPSRW